MLCGMTAFRQNENANICVLDSILFKYNIFSILRCIKGKYFIDFQFSFDFSNCNAFSSFSDDHGFSPLHWLAKEGHTKLVEMLLQRGARVNATNMGDDIPLHLAVAHGHLDIVLLVR